ncbi:uncharacterized protein LOC118648168 isoform X2 [Monomorium pharaonis]|uniref:uncharacterized protein LOC118648076 isoform X2 n=1 Tax=Monomorium pharaonis TaxID=307658 RepID=UPI001746CB83|nr:uncharacterized protein LOC118648076 isoform X2 [Monomorium pharaonis]XP_036150366.1 uncharacterized protein LOC118648168 isoform X2 [Monomorium pharaonis]
MLYNTGNIKQHYKMPIFKVIGQEFSRKTLVVCDNLKDLINTSIQHLGLPNVEYTVVLQDKTEIHDDKVLIALSDSSPTPVTVTLIEKQILCGQNDGLCTDTELNNPENEMLLTVLDSNSIQDQSDIKIIPIILDDTNLSISNDKSNVSQSKDVLSMVDLKEVDPTSTKENVPIIVLLKEHLPYNTPIRYQ